MTDDTTYAAALASISQQTGFSAAALTALADALQRGGGTMAQFAHPEFGGSGQWMRGGMTMSSDLFDTALNGRIDRAATALATAMAGRAEADAGSGSAAPAGAHVLDGVPPGRTAGAAAHAAPRHWWPEGLGDAASTGSQNDVRYAWFPSSRRLAIETDGTLTVYDTGDHRIGGVSQQQSSGYSLTFSSDQGDIDLASLRVVDGPQRS